MITIVVIMKHDNDSYNDNEDNEDDALALGL